MSSDGSDPLWDEIRDPPLHYDRGGRAISLRRWTELMEDDEYRRVGHTLVAARWEVSTVWLGLDHNFWGGLPLIFETMVFDADGPTGRDDLEMERYSTEEQAQEGHERMVQLVMTLESADGRDTERSEVGDG